MIDKDSDHFQLRRFARDDVGASIIDNLKGQFSRVFNAKGSKGLGVSRRQGQVNCGIPSGRITRDLDSQILQCPKPGHHTGSLGAIHVAFDPSLVPGVDKGSTAA